MGLEKWAIFDKDFGAGARAYRFTSASNSHHRVHPVLPLTALLHQYISIREGPLTEQV